MLGLLILLNVICIIASIALSRWAEKSKWVIKAKKFDRIQQYSIVLSVVSIILSIAAYKYL